jgi:outer membrane protein assembly factor BamB
VDGNTLFTGDEGGGLFALEAGSGAFLWKLDTGSAWYTPKFREGVLYIGGTRMIAVDSGTHQIRWANDEFTYLTAPAVGDTAVYAAGFGRKAQPGPDGKDVEEEQHVFAFDLATGAILWRSAEPVLTRGAPAWRAPRVVVAGERATSFDDATGETAWSRPIFASVSDPDASPAIGHENVYVIGDAIHCFDFATGASCWTHPGGNSRTTPVVTADAVVVNDGNFDQPSRLVALDPLGNRDGTTRELWSVPVEGNASSPIVVDGQVLYVETVEGGWGRLVAIR